MKKIGSKLFRDILTVYLRHDGLQDAWAAWRWMAAKLGSEGELHYAMKRALTGWQGDQISAYGWQSAPQLARYILGRRWEDEPEVTSAGLPRHPAVLYNAVDKVTS